MIPLELWNSPEMKKRREPGNCRWATKAEQNQNSRANRRITIGTRTQHLSAWAVEAGIDRKIISARIDRGWESYEAVFTPVSPVGTNQYSKVQKARVPCAT